ncbi:MAG TPA: hypothetical protein VMM60_02810 [Ilumatobacter sp.]|nr:hypothetical protein [Ilumatobacter sp.]
MAAALVLLFTFTAGGIIWLGRDVNETVALRSTAQSIAFQAARAGAQEIVLGALRDEGDTDITLDHAVARNTALAQGREMIEAYAVEGVVADVAIDGNDNVTVTVHLVGPGGAKVTGVGIAHPESR